MPGSYTIGSAQIQVVPALDMRGFPRDVNQQLKTIKPAIDVDTSKANSKIRGLSTSIGTAFGTGAGFLGAKAFTAGLAKVTDFVGGSVDAFSNLNESLNAVNKIFGASQQKILDWGKTTANSFGLSQRAFNDLAVPLGAGLKNAGIPLDMVADKTIVLTERAADMASVFNTTVPEALEAIQAGLRGESDPLERFGVGLSAAKVEARALADTGKKTAAALTSQEKATARLNLIMDQTASTAGDFRGTSDGLANAQRIAAAKTEELQAQIGEKLAPVIATITALKLKLVEVVADKLMPLLDRLGTWMSENPGKVKAFAIVIGSVLVLAFIAWAVAAGAAAVATIAATWPIIAIVAAIAALVAGLIYAYTRWETFRTIVQAAVAGVRAAIMFTWSVIKPILDVFASFVTTVLGPALLWLWRAVVQPAMAGIGNTIVWVWSAVIQPVFAALRTGVGLVGQAFESAVAFIARVWNRLQEVAAIPVNFVIETVYNNGIKAVWDRVAGFVGLPLLPRAHPIGIGGGGGQRGNRAFAVGGILPGYTPGRDVHRFWSPTAGVLDLSGGEPVLRPEVGRVLGASWVDGVNGAARAGGVSAVQRYLGGFADGGIMGRLEGIANTARNWTVGLIADPLGTIRRMFGDPAAQVRRVLGDAPYVNLIGRVPAKLVDTAATWLADKLKAAFGSLGGGSFGATGNWPPARMGVLAANTAAAVEFVRRTFGINNIGTLGNRPNKSDHPMGKALDVMIPAWQTPAGIAKGNSVASWFVARPAMFGTKYVIWRDQINQGRGWAPYVHPNGPTNNPTLQHRDHVHVSLYDDGGWLPPGWNTVYNGTGRPEAVFTAEQLSAIQRGRTSERHYHLQATTVPTADITKQFRWMEMLDGP